MNSGDYNMWTDVLIMSVPIAAICFALLACKVNSWLNSGKEVNRG